MRFGAIVTVIAAMLPCVCMAGPKKDQPLHAALELPTIVTMDMRAAEAETALPDAPDVPIPTFSVDAPVVVAPPATVSLRQKRFSRAVSPLYSLPMVNTAMRLGRHNFNTDDGSSLDAFAICYRLNDRSSVQVIPGDPAPVKLPVSTMRNNVGVTVGMVYRLSRRR